MQSKTTKRALLSSLLLHLRCAPSLPISRRSTFSCIVTTNRNQNQKKLTSLGV